MTTKPTGGPAFPLPLTADPVGGVYQADQFEGGAGMSLRDYAAIHFMAAMIANGFRPISADADNTYVACGFRLADAFIAERDK